MSPEEFDNRLRSSFQDEHLPPGDHLWVNVTEKLDAKAGRPLWYWLLPVLVAVTACVMWIGYGLTGSGSEERMAERSAGEGTSRNEAPVDAQRDQVPYPASSADLPAAENNESVPSPETSVALSTGRERGPEPSSSLSRGSDAPRFSPSARSNRTAPAGLSGLLTGNPALSARPEGNTGFALTLAEELARSLAYARIPLNAFSLSAPSEKAVDMPLPEDKKDDPAPAPAKNKRQAGNADFESRHWLNAGIGPQMALNSLVINSDSQAWVHKHLWSNRDKMTHNGSGLQGFATYAYKFGKNNRFQFETGLSFSLRSENIRLNESSYDIPARDANGKIVLYTPITVIVIIPNMSGGYDTTSYSAVSNFSLAVSNKYRVFTIPLRFHTEQKITDNTFVSLGLGSGLSYIQSSSSEHVDMIRGNNRKQSKSSMFTASLGSQLSVYTRFNEIGQIGLYTGYQMYLSPWKVNSDQYAIRMSDVQFGIVFRKPL